MFPPFDKGFTNATYNAEVTNFNGHIIPASFTFTRFGVHQTGRNQRELGTLVEVTGKLTRLMSLKNAERLQPAFTGVIQVIDTRLKDARPPVKDVIYSVTNGAWPSLDELKQGSALR